MSLDALRDLGFVSVLLTWNRIGIFDTSLTQDVDINTRMMIPRDLVLD